MKILITGTAGFIGFHLAEALAKEGHDVTGLDNINDYYDIRLKYARLAESGVIENEIEYNRFAYSKKYTNYKFIKLNLEDNENIQALFKTEKFEVVCNLAAQAGVRYSIENPYSYIQSNIVGFLNILEACRHNNIQHLVYASSSSVYGNSQDAPFTEDQLVNQPVSLYAATKVSNELMAYSYSHLYQLKSTGLRFFTVYGPWGRPDMAPFIFTDSIINGRKIKVFNNGELYRDFTYISDIVNGTVKIVNSDPNYFFNVYNIGCSRTVFLMDFIKTLENQLKLHASMEFLPMQSGDVIRTYADTGKIEIDHSYIPSVNLEEGIQNFIIWYLDYFSK